MSVTQIKLTEAEYETSLVKSDGPVGNQTMAMLKGIAKEYRVSVYSLAVLGGKPYPMQGALFQMLANKCGDEGLKVTKIVSKPLTRATPQELRAGHECDIALYDEKGFLDALKALKGSTVDVAMLQTLKEQFTHHYHDEGWASPESVKMRTLHNMDYINHMASTRAIDRTLRIIVRCPFTPASEMPDAVIDADAVARAPVPDETPIARPRGKGPRIIDVPASAVSEVPAATATVTLPPEPKGEAINEKQIAMLMARWGNYVKERASGLKSSDIDDKANRLIEALFGVKSKKDLTKAHLQELLDMMERGEIEVVSG
jgi:hypothetical protein